MPDQIKVAQSSKIGDTDRAEAVSQLTFGLKALSSAKAGGVSGTCFVDVSERLARLLASVEQASFVIDLPLANKLHTAVAKLLRKPPIGRGTTIKLTRASVDTTRRVLTTVTRALAVSAKSRERKRKAQVEGFVKRCSNIICQSCEMADTPAAWKNALAYLRDASSIASLSFEALLSEQGLGHSYSKIEAGIIEAMRLALEQGDISTLSEFAGVFRRHQEIRDKANRFMSQLFSDRASTLPAASQQWMLNQLGLTVAGPSVEYANPADSPAVRQAATLLLYLFDQQTRNAELKEAFERFHTLCEMHFHLFLRGTVGSRTTFDSRLHETPERTAGELRLVRPWVEWYMPPNARIVIRGIVEQERHEKEA